MENNIESWNEYCNAMQDLANEDAAYELWLEEKTNEFDDTWNFL